MGAGRRRHSGSRPAPGPRRGCGALACTGGCARRIRGHPAAVRALPYWHRRDAVRRSGGMDSALQRQLSPRRGRRLAAAHPAQQLHHRARGLGRLGGDPVEGRSIHGRLPDHVGVDQWRVRGTRRRALLRFLRGDAGSAVPDHRHLGRPEPGLRSDQILSLHAAGLTAHAGGAHLPVLDQRWQLFDPRVVSVTSVAQDADPAFRRLLCRILGEGPHVAGAHLASRRTYRGTNRRLGSAGGDHPQGRRLWLHPFRPAHSARCKPLSLRIHDRALAHRHRLYRIRCTGAAGHETADRLFVDLAHGLCHARPVPFQRHGCRRRFGADDFAWIRVRGTVSLCRRSL